MTVLVENEVQEQVNVSIILFILFKGDSYDFFRDVVKLVEGFEIVHGFPIA